MRNTQGKLHYAVPINWNQTTVVLEDDAEPTSNKFKREKVKKNRRNLSYKL